jgi:NSS family neurotransmitter:Na+ symporter
MSQASEETREHWSGSLAFVLAAVGSAVGLGNVWKFPYITGMHGGGAFVLVYLGCIALVGLPILMAEMVVGRRSQAGPVGAFRSLAAPDRGGKLWSIWGYFAILTGFLLLSFYSVVGGWTVAYALKSVFGQFASGTPSEIKAMFGAYSGDPVSSTMSHAIFMVVTIGVVYSGVSKGIERAARTLMPAFFLLLIFLLGYATATTGFGEAMNFMFQPNFSDLTAAGILEALGHSFFTLSLGMGAVIIYGSYLPKDSTLYGSAIAIGFFDTFVALTAGVVIFTIVFSQGMAPGSGPSLVFETMPVLFSQIPYGSLLSTAFFTLLAFAALTSGISLLEVVVSFFVEEFDMDRHLAALGLGGAIFFFGLLSVLSNSLLADFKPFGATIFGNLDYFISNWALPLGGFGVAVFAGWGVDRDEWWDEMKDDWFGRTAFRGWLFLTRVVAPLAIILILMNLMGFLSLEA